MGRRRLDKYLYVHSHPRQTRAHLWLKHVHTQPALPPLPAYHHLPTATNAAHTPLCHPRCVVLCWSGRRPLVALCRTRCHPLTPTCAGPSAILSCPCVGSVAASIDVDHHHPSESATSTPPMSIPERRAPSTKPGHRTPTFIHQWAARVGPPSFPLDCASSPTPLSLLSSPFCRVVALLLPSSSAWPAWLRWPSLAHRCPPLSP
jgi:hypothetical protein